MAQHVSRGHVEEFVKRMEERFDDLNQQMPDFRAEMRQMRNWLVRLYGLMVASFIGAIVLILPNALRASTSEAVLAFSSSS